MISALGNAIFYAAVGILIFFAAAIGLKQSRLWNQAVDDRNMPAAIILAAVVLGLALIISAAVH